MNKKIMKAIAIVIFLWLFASCILSSCRIIAGGYLFYLSPISIIVDAINLISLGMCVVLAITQKKLKLLSIAAITHILCILWGFIATVIGIGMISISMKTSLFYLVLFIAAYACIVKTNVGNLFAVNDTKSEASKVQLQGKKQNEIYEQQLKDGIISQKEYNQLTGRNKV